ncbi:MAG: UDP-N-acetylglucosamine--N-acetylmuramyl-(pentapeptide) pyrophosphoryl-undecaprenol N-acetylglucosamine transferase [Planctomycetota bacterium]|jgi:UDP-N-acetylglucosamine--N-acetylmuramyl-(pentapeptide) pyrophosphoryl-undecaprenol N-acetylglucosamine transferase
MRIAFAGGGTGGHIVPGIHLVERSCSSDRDAPQLSDLLWFTSGRSVEDRVFENFEPDCAWQRVILPVEPPGGGAPSLLRLGTHTPQAVLAARRELKRHGTQVLLGLGGFTTLPAALAARSLGLPVGLLEINAARGKATRSLSPIVQRVFHAWRSTLPASGADHHDRHVGAPVSPAVARLGMNGCERAQACRDLGFDPGRALLVVLGGSQGAGSLNSFISVHHAQLRSAGVQVLHQCGPNRRSELPADSDSFRVEEYFSPVASALEAATLVLCRGGASTLAEITAARIPAVVVPYPHHSDHHQELNARQLGEGVRIIPDDRLDELFAGDLVEFCSDGYKDRRMDMALALADIAPTDASLEILRDLAYLTLSGSR